MFAKQRSKASRKLSKRKLLDPLGRLAAAATQQLTPPVGVCEASAHTLCSAGRPSGSLPAPGRQICCTRESSAQGDDKFRSRADESAETFCSRGPLVAGLEARALGGAAGGAQPAHRRTGRQLTTCDRSPKIVDQFECFEVAHSAKAQERRRKQQSSRSSGSNNNNNTSPTQHNRPAHENRQPEENPTCAFEVKPNERNQNREPKAGSSSEELKLQQSSARR